MENDQINKRFDLLQQQLQLLSQAQKPDQPETRITPKPQTLRLQIRCGRIWGYVTFSLPEGYNIKKLEDDIDKITEQIPVFQSNWKPKVTRNKRSA
jgi:hypothetical protein